MKSKIKTILFAFLFVSTGMLLNSFYYSVANDNGNPHLNPEPQGQEGWVEISAENAVLYTSKYNPETDKTNKGVNIPNDVLQKILSDHPGGIERIYMQLAIENDSTNVVFVAGPKDKNERAKYYMSTNAAPVCPIMCPNM